VYFHASNVTSGTAEEGKTVEVVVVPSAKKTGTWQAQTLRIIETGTGGSTSSSYCRPTPQSQPNDPQQFHRSTHPKFASRVDTAPSTNASSSTTTPTTSGGKRVILAVVIDGYSFASFTRYNEDGPNAIVRLIKMIIGKKTNAEVIIPQGALVFFHPNPVDAFKHNLINAETKLRTHDYLEGLRQNSWQVVSTPFKLVGNTYKATMEDVAIANMTNKLSTCLFAPFEADRQRTADHVVMITGDGDFLPVLDSSQGGQGSALRWCAINKNQPNYKLRNWGETTGRLIQYDVDALLTSKPQYSKRSRVNCPSGDQCENPDCASDHPIITVLGIVDGRQRSCCLRNTTGKAKFLSKQSGPKFIKLCTNTNAHDISSCFFAHLVKSNPTAVPKNCFKLEGVEGYHHVNKFVRNSGFKCANQTNNRTGKVCPQGDTCSDIQNCHDLHFDNDYLNERRKLRENARRSANKTEAGPTTSHTSVIPCCVICLEPASDGVKCANGHHTCDECLSNYITITWNEIDHISGEIPDVICSANECDAIFSVRDIARRASDDALDLYQLKRRTAVEGIAMAKAAEIARSAANAKEAEIEMVRQQLILDMPRALMCPECNYGPVDFSHCDDLAAHHGELTQQGTRISNACPNCGFFASTRHQWIPWDHKLRELQGVDAGSPQEEPVPMSPQEMVIHQLLCMGFYQDHIALAMPFTQELGVLTNFLIELGGQEPTRARFEHYCLTQNVNL
jgi:hypothetical protein